MSPQNKTNVQALGALVSILLALGTLVFMTGAKNRALDDLTTRVVEMEKTRVTRQEFETLKEDVKEIKSDVKTLLRAIPNK